MAPSLRLLLVEVTKAVLVYPEAQIMLGSFSELHGSARPSSSSRPATLGGSALWGALPSAHQRCEAAFFQNVSHRTSPPSRHGQTETAPGHHQRRDAIAPKAVATCADPSAMKAARRSLR